MAQPRTAVSFVLALVVCGLLLGWLLYTPGDAGPVDPAAPGGVAAAPTEPAAALQAAGGAKEHAPTPAADGSRTEVAGGATAASRFALTGRLVDGAGAPVPEVDVGFFAMGEGPGRRVRLAPPDLQPAEPGARARTGADGRFRVLLPATEDQRLALLGEGHYLKDADLGDSLLVAGLTADRDLGDLAIGRAASIAGWVEEQGSGRRCAEVSVATGVGPLAMPFRARAPKTDAEGGFSIRNLRPGEHTLTTASPDYLPSSAKVTLAEGEQRADFALRVQPGGAIAGIVVDDTGKPLPGMKVGGERARSLRPGVDVQSTTTAEATTTDAAGRFVLRGVDASVVNVSAWGPGHGRARQENVAAGATDVLLRLPRLASIRGHVRDETGAPVAGSEVWAEASGGGPLGLRFADGGEVRTGAQGEFALDGVAPGRCVVHVNGDHIEGRSQALAVEPGQVVEGVNVVVRRGSTLVVKVEDTKGQPVAGAEVEVSAAADESEATGVRNVTMERRVGGRGGDHVRIDDGRLLGSATSGEDGIARVRGLAAGRVRAEARHANFARGRSPVVAVPEGGSVETGVQVAVGGFVQVAVIDAGRRPLAGASFKLTGPSEAGETRTETGESDAAGTARVGPLLPGTYKARLGVANRPTSLGDGASFMVVGDRDRDLPESEVTVVVVAEQTTAVTLVRPQLATLRGVVRDAKGPVAGARVRLASPGGIDLPFDDGASATTDADGRYEIGDLSAGRYALRFGYADAVAMSEADLTIAPGEALIERDLLLRTGTVRLIVRGEDGNPVARAQVTLERAGRAPASGPRRTERRAVMIMARTADGDGGASTTQISTGTPSVTTDIEGVAEIARVPEGDYTLRIQHARHATERRDDVKVLDGATTDLGTITMGPGGVVTGQVRLPDGTPPPMALVELTPLPNGEPRVETAMGGQIRITGLAAGSFRARARAMGPPGGAGQEWGAPVEFELGKGERKAIELRLP